MSKANEWDLVKRQFDALMHDERVGAESIDEIFDVQFRRRLTELINQPNIIARQLAITGPDANGRNVPYWPLADISTAPTHVRFRG